jgi:hypothetical protein
MDLDVLILSGGGGAAISNTNNLSGACVNSGHGGGGAVFQGTIPIEPGSTVPIVIGAGGAGAGPSPNNTNAEGAIGGCSSITFPEGTICVAGGGGGAPVCLQIGNFASYSPLCCASHGTHTAGTGGSGGSSSVTDNGTCGIAVGPGICPASAGVGGRSIYSSGSFTSVSVISNDSVQCYVKAMIFRGTNVQNHKYGQFSGAPASGGANRTSSPAPTRFNSQASGGAGGGGESDAGTFTNGTNVFASFRAGRGVCSNISGTLHEYGQGRVAISPVNWPTCCDGEANYGAGGVAGQEGDGVCNGGSGGSGTVIVRYPTQFAAAPLTPGATNCSPVTPGYYTYRFNSSGSITLP